MQRKIKNIRQAQPVMEGAGVHLKRAFGYHQLPDYDPFLLMDDFRNDDPKDYLAGFPWHPHRGIETITYMLEGSAEHADSLGNSGVIGKGDVQWMTAGSGIIHQEMPKPDAQGKMYGFQLWTNLPKEHKMTAPRYQDIKASEIPVVKTEAGTTIKVISGEYMGVRGPVQDVYAQPYYLDVEIPANTRQILSAPAGLTAFIYVYAGQMRSDDQNLQNTQVVLFEDGDEILFETGKEACKFLMMMGKALNEPIAWHGPIVMNTKAEIRQALKDLQEDSFIK